MQVAHQPIMEGGLASYLQSRHPHGLVQGLWLALAETVTAQERCGLLHDPGMSCLRGKQ